MANWNIPTKHYKPRRSQRRGSKEDRPGNDLRIDPMKVKVVPLLFAQEKQVSLTGL
jgi:hypothetical protein